MEKMLFILIMLLAIIIPLHNILKQKEKKQCPKCSGNLKLLQVEDSMGVNINKKISFSIYQGPRKYKETWKCENCSNKVKFTYWGT